MAGTCFVIWGQEEDRPHNGPFYFSLFLGEGKENYFWTVLEMVTTEPVLQKTCFTWFVCLLVF